MTNGWEESAAAWIATQGADGDFARRFILDAPMLERARLCGARTALDVGCGEGRFCRKLAAQGLTTTGIDPAEALVREARRLHPEADYRIAAAERLPFEDAAFELVVTYLSLIDIADVRAAISEMHRVLRPSGRLLIANHNSFFSASNPTGWRRKSDGTREFVIDHYIDERTDWVGWRGIQVQNWHRPLSAYMTLLLGTGLQLRHFAEPLVEGGDAEQAALQRRVPAFVLMEWEKPSPDGTFR